MELLWLWWHHRRNGRWCCWRNAAIAAGVASGGINSMGGLQPLGMGHINWLLNKSKNPNPRMLPLRLSRRRLYDRLCRSGSQKYREAGIANMGQRFRG